MLLYLTTLGVVNFLTEDEPPESSDQETNIEVMANYDSWRRGDYLFVNTSRQVWENLDRKYCSDNAGNKKFVTAKFLDYKMVDTRPVMEQVQEFQMIIHELAAEGMALPDNFTTGTTIEKLPPSWRDFKSYLKHKRKEMTFEDLIVKVRIEADVRKNDQKAKGTLDAKANLLERAGHLAKDCRNKKKKSAAQVIEKEFKDWDESDPIAVVIEEVNLVNNKGGWYIDIGATAHVCEDRSMFSTYNNVEGRKINMGNQASSEVLGVGDVVLKMTSDWDM
ncbi:uncharacterized protein LOC121803814 [Salvia splendens]|uniref:uncharacterized protein LOC121803814 n=1 Tax=Salvia splendens TaxID=180675 RepID=UPI001C26EB0D|nr:uncharacterized protein LOC121803814 [Salvia splendens]